MKVLFLNASLGSGGSERVMSILANYFSENNINTHMILLREKEKVYELDEKVVLHEIHHNKNNKILMLFERLRKVRRIIKEEKPDVIISFMWDINVFSIFANVGFKSKLIISERAHPKMGTQNIMRTIAQKFLYIFADKIVFQTEQVKDYFRKRIVNKSVVISNPIDIDITNLVLKKEKSIVAVGRLVAQKNFSLLISAFRSVNSKHNDYVLNIFGEGIQRAKLEGLIKQYHLEDKVFLKGFSNDILEEMSKSSIYVSSSDFEGISNSMLEAMSIGLPSVCTDCPVGGASMAIQDGVNGLLVPVGDEEAIANAINRLIEDDSLYDLISN